MKRAASRPRVRGALQLGRTRVGCKRYKEFGHFEKTCKRVEASEEGDDDIDQTPRKRQFCYLQLQVQLHC
uniref:Uncharacterized protein n=1 Tax=Arundo donax TaxID=35708 RepID=A0A0A9GY92_ARUDO